MTARVRLGAAAHRAIGFTELEQSSLRQLRA